MTVPEDPLPMLAVRLGVVNAGNEILTRLDAERHVFRGEWLSRPQKDTSREARKAAFWQTLTQDINAYELLERLLGPSIEELHDGQANAMELTQAALGRYRENTADRDLRTRLAACLMACTVATDTVRWHTSMAAGFYDYYQAGVVAEQLFLVAELVHRTLTAPIMRACDAVLSGAPLSQLRAALDAAEPVTAQAQEYLAEFNRTARVGAEYSRKVMAALAAAELTYSVYRAGLGVAGGRPPPPPRAAAVVGGSRAMVRVSTTVYDWEALLRQIAVAGGIGLQAAMAKVGGNEPPEATPGAGKTPAASPSGEDPDDSFGGTSNYGVGKAPQPAPDNLYAAPRNERQAASWVRGRAAFEASQAGETSQAIMRRLGYFAMRVIYPEMIRIVRGGRGLAYFGGTATKGFIESLRGQTRRAMFIETTVRWGGRNLRIDAFEVTFRASKDGADLVEITDLTTSLRMRHLFKTADYAKVFQALGFRVKAADIILTDGTRLLDEFVVIPATIP